VQVVLLPNGIIGYVYLTSLHRSDAGLLNMSGLDNHLSKLLQGYTLPGARNQLPPALYADGIFPQLTTIVARYRSPSQRQGHISICMASFRQCVEHLYSIHFNLFALFRRPEQFQLLVAGIVVYKMMFASFFVLNCYQCIYKTSSNFQMGPMSLEEYIPLDEELELAPEVPDEELGEVYDFFV
jgi:hypothetical protein